MLTVYKKDLHNYFSTFVGYVFIAAVLLSGGIYVFINNFMNGYASFGTSINSVPFFFVFLIPVISAGIFTDEKRQKTDQLLYTLPLTSRQIVFGKYLALITVLAVPLLILGIYPLIMSAYGEVNFVQAYANLFAVFLLGMALCAICMFISSLTESIIVSAILCFACMFLLYQLNSFSEALTGSQRNSIIGFALLAVALAVFIWFMTKNIYIALIPSLACALVLVIVNNASKVALAGKINLVMSSVSVFNRMNNFMNGILDVTALIYYLSIIVLFVLFTVYTFERKRWN
jgi:ABC-2 type transport system permease protein